MIQRDIDKAALVLFAAREVGPKGSLEQMKAVCACMRNRVRAGWHDGRWISVIEDAQEHSAHEGQPVFQLAPERREFQRLVHEIDDLYLGARPMNDFEGDSDGMPSGGEVEDTIRENNEMYWAFLNRPMRDWFKENIVKDPENHKNVTTFGIMMFYQ